MQTGDFILKNKDIPQNDQKNLIKILEATDAQISKDLGPCILAQQNVLETKLKKLREALIAQDEAKKAELEAEEQMSVDTNPPVGSAPKNALPPLTRGKSPRRHEGPDRYLESGQGTKSLRRPTPTLPPIQRRFQGKRQRRKGRKERLPQGKTLTLHRNKHRAHIYNHKSAIYRVNNHVSAKFREKICKDPTVVPTNIVNTSNHILTSSEIKLLNRGLSFVPKPSKIYLENILSDFDQLVRKMTFRYFFRSSKRKMNRYRRKSSAPAKRTSNKTLEAALDTMRDLITNLSYEQHPGTNLTIAERKALRELMDNNALIINKADKGSTIVIQNHKEIMP